MRSGKIFQLWIILLPNPTIWIESFPLFCKWKLKQNLAQIESMTRRDLLIPQLLLNEWRCSLKKIHSTAALLRPGFCLSVAVFSTFTLWSTPTIIACAKQCSSINNVPSRRYQIISSFQIHTLGKSTRLLWSFTTCERKYKVKVCGTVWRVADFADPIIRCRSSSACCTILLLYG